MATWFRHSAYGVGTKKARIVVENWRRHYNTVRPHSSLDTDTHNRGTRLAGKAHGANARSKLTFQLDHSVGADQRRL